jgi:small nuclear ribonucleoprotein (snRNP)-like protein
MEGYEVIVELKTGRRIRGILSSADDYMNLTLDDVQEATQTSGTPNSDITRPPKQASDLPQPVGASDHPTIPSQSEIAGDLAASSILSSLNMRGPKIRYIHFPDNADLTAIVWSGVERERNAANKYKRTKRK